MAKKHRSPNFPFINLAEAVERARSVHSKLHRYAAQPIQIKEALGYTDKSSKGIQILGALRGFGLLSDAKGQGERLSDLALNILLDEVDDSPARMAAIREAAMAPPVHRMLREAFPDGLPPSDAVVRTLLVRDHGFSADAATALIKEYRATLAYARLDGSVEVDKERDIEHDGDADITAPQTVETITKPQPRQKPVPHPLAGGPVEEIRLPMFQGRAQIVLQMTEPLTRGQWDKMVKALEALKEVHSVDDGSDLLS